ncbi:MAG: DUF2752 domain-containing protein [Mariniblastus sp.]
MIPANFIRSEIRLHVFFVVLAAGILLASMLMSSQGETGVYLPGLSTPMPPTCASRRLFDLECPGCGMTRAFISISHGQFARAWKFNPASFIVYAFAAAQIPWHLMQIWRLRTNRLPVAWTWTYFIPIFIVIVMLSAWIWKLTT